MFQMRSFLLAAVAAVLSMVSLTTAEAKRHMPSTDGPVPFWEQSDEQPARHRGHARRQYQDSDDSAAEAALTHRSRRRHRDSDEGSYDIASGHEGLRGRPSAWCGWYMRSRHGGGPEYNLAANWRHRGSPTTPHVGAIVVWDHHVGEITGQAANGQWIVLSGNDSHTVRERPRSVAGAVFRDI